MPEDRSESGGREIPAEVYQALAAADAAARADRLLRLIEAHPEGRLELPARDGAGATLDEIDLSPPGAEARRAGAAGPAAWWDAERRAVNLNRADLRGASLRLANLRGILLEEADLEGADLAGADLAGANLSEADLSSATLEEAKLPEASLRFARGRDSVLEGADLRGADLWGADFAGADLTGADLRGAVLEEANFEGADLRGADLRGAVLRSTNLKGANLHGADLRDAVFGRTNLAAAVLRDARLQAAVLTGCDLTHAHVADAWLERTRLEQGQLGGAIGEELSREYEPARKGYLVLERNFTDLGDPDAASWAYRRKRRMQKREAFQKARQARAEGRWGRAVRLTLQAAGDQLVEWVCDYGESVPRVLASLLAVYLLFVVLYGATGAVLRAEETLFGTTKAPTYDVLDLALFSLTAMTAPGNPPPALSGRSDAVYLLAGAQTLLSIFLTGLLGFVAGNRIRR